jgi:DmsE family decaheme c-type cytochrome
MLIRVIQIVVLLSVCVLSVVIHFSCTSYEPRDYTYLFQDKTIFVEGATRVGNKGCLRCHDEPRHLNLPYYYKNHCEECHGGGSLHVEDEKAKGKIAFPSNDKCLDCHEVARKTLLFNWETSEHERAGLACIDCHNPHLIKGKFLKVSSDIRLDKIDERSNLCLSCHQEILGRLSLPSHHPIKEGALACVDCHNPHGDARISRLHVNELCFECHQAIQGPWLWEHAPVVEDCSICHNPHGTVHPKLQEIAQPTLCLQCHSLAANRHASTGTADNSASIGAVIFRDCTACHGAIHGANQDRHFRY